ncbi:protamine-like protein 99C [Drosophila rhopaloa]|uniref:Histone-like protein 18C n=1 Tax=Drosophila rhopaloa TaxID=1041015 RepID=A0A6P4EU51_DRORH|nr:protamine-like protein 99C [Drosophila rhopaloa]
MSLTTTGKVSESPSMSNGSLIKNGFLNYMRDFCRRNSNLSWLESAKEGARSWKQMTEEEKDRYRTGPITDMGILAMTIDNEPTQRPSDMCNHPMAKSSAKSKKSCAKPKKSCAMTKKMAACGKPKRMACAKPKKAACAKPRKAACAKPARKPACPKPKKSACATEQKYKCSKPGPITNNGYLNFVRAFRKKNCDLKPQELIMKAAKAWSMLPEEKKDRYRRMACKVTHSKRHQRRRVCKPC